jgi:hypothetical protein
VKRKIVATTIEKVFMEFILAPDAMAYLYKLHIRNNPWYSPCKVSDFLLLSD